MQNKVLIEVSYLNEPMGAALQLRSSSETDSDLNICDVGIICFMLSR